MCDYIEIRKRCQLVYRGEKGERAGAARSGRPVGSHILLFQLTDFLTGKGGHGVCAGFALKKYVPYKLQVRGSKATLFANGKEVCTFDDPVIAQGGYISCISGMAKVSFKNFKVTVK